MQVLLGEPDEAIGPPWLPTPFRPGPARGRRRLMPWSRPVGRGTVPTSNQQPAAPLLDGRRSGPSGDGLLSPGAGMNPAGRRGLVRRGPPAGHDGGESVAAFGVRRRVTPHHCRGVRPTPVTPRLCEDHRLAPSRETGQLSVEADVDEFDKAINAAFRKISRRCGCPV